MFSCSVNGCQNIWKTNQNKNNQTGAISDGLGREILLSMQWRDKKVVSFLSSMHHADRFGFADRRSEVNGQYRTLNVRQPKHVKDYNAYMGGVDKSDSLIKNKIKNKIKTTFRKTNKWWKTLFYHFLDIARVNAFILFEDFRKKHADIPELKVLTDVDSWTLQQSWLGSLQILMYMLMFLLFKNKQTKNCVHNAFTIPVMTKERLLLFLFLFLFFIF